MAQQMDDKGQDAKLQEELDGLKTEYTKLHEDKLRTEQDLAHVKQQLEELEKQAREEYGTADPKELEQLLAAKREKNVRLVTEYREHIESIKKGLSTLDEQVGDHA